MRIPRVRRVADANLPVASGPAQVSPVQWPQTVGGCILLMVAPMHLGRIDQDAFA
jgi:hypothetical protein